MSTETLGYQRQYTTIERLVRKKSFWFVMWAVLFSYPIYRSVNRDLPQPLPKMHQVPAFEFTNEFNKPFGSNDLKGKIYIANFMFTSCPTTCPGLMKNMQRVQKRVRGLGQNIGLLTFSVDPVNDTPDVLHKYARDLHANPYVWNFVTGDQEKIRKTLLEGFKVPVGDKKEPMTKIVGQEKVTVWDIVHTEKLVLVDGEGFVRGYYSTDKNSINKLMIDVGLLYNRSSF